MSHFAKLNFDDDPNLGLYGFATDSYFLVGKNLSKKEMKKAEDVLKVKVHIQRVMFTEFAGLFATGNSKGIVAPKVAKHYDFSPKVDTLLIDTDYSAVGNLILMNDNGIILSPMLKNCKKEIESFFKIPCRLSTIAGVRIVGSMGIATNRGCLLHPKAKDDEIKKIEEVLKVKAEIGTVAFGSSFPGAGIIANSNGFLASEKSSGPELGRITEALGFL